MGGSTKRESQSVIHLANWMLKAYGAGYWHPDMMRIAIELPDAKHALTVWSRENWQDVGCNVLC